MPEVSETEAPPQKDNPLLFIAVALDSLWVTHKMLVDHQIDVDEAASRVGAAVTVLRAGYGLAEPRAQAIKPL